MTPGLNEAASKNQIIPLEVTGVSHEGVGVGRYNGMAVFVPMTAPGDVLTVKIVKTLSSHAFGIIEKIISPSPQREENKCPVYRRCGGCSLRHISYDAEMEIKEGWIRENLKRIGHMDVPFDSPLPSRCSDRYRNKAQFPVRAVNGRPAAGFFARRSHELVPVEDCLLQPEMFRDITSAFLVFMREHGIEAYDEKGGTGLVRHLYLRLAEATGQVMACIVVNGGGIPHDDTLVSVLKAACPSIETIALNLNRQRGNAILGANEKVIYGKGHINDTLCGLSINISPGSFYQVNRSGAESLYGRALEYASPKPSDLLLDLYCGAGTIGLSMASHMKRVIGVEQVESAVRNARENAAANGVENAEFYLSDAAGAVKTLGISPDIVILDPPRKGVDRETLDLIALMSPRKIVYISCNSATLARDCAILAERGYKAARATAVDLFPRTAHMETVVQLVR